MSVTFTATPAATSSSMAPRPPGVAGTLIIRFVCPAAHFLPSSMYVADRSAVVFVCAVSSSSGSSSKLTHPSSPLVFSHTSVEHVLRVLHQLVGHGPRDGLVVQPLGEERLHVGVEPAGLEQVRR